jgi:ribose transport system ATP-binding protein
MNGVSKSFFDVTVLDRVDFVVREGEVHALLGENGAGKSTLMNILAGVLDKDAGSVRFDGRQFDHITVKESENAGIAFVHQELNLFNDLTVYENIYLRKEIIGALGILNKKAMIENTRDLFNRLGVDIDPAALVSELDTSKKQLLEIAKALFAQAKLFILDEPTTALNSNEIEHLFSIIRRLKAEGKTFIFISHKMNEIFAIADRYTVLNNGRMVMSGDIKDTNPREVTRLMVGGKLVDAGYYFERKLGNPVLILRGLTGSGFENVDLTVREGEVIGFTGLKGAGISELFQTIFGVLPMRSGDIELFGRKINKQTIHGAMRSRVAMIAANRKENSIIPDMALLENFYASEHVLSRRRQVIRRRKEVANYDALRDKLGVKAADPLDLITSLSGGNQQKVILARWLNTNAKILIMDNPTQGIDVGAKAEIYKLILELANSGITVLFNTLEIPEIQKVADRCIVFFHGRIQAELERNDISEEKVMLCATGAANMREDAI